MRANRTPAAPYRDARRITIWLGKSFGFSCCKEHRECGPLQQRCAPPIPCHGKGSRSPRREMIGSPSASAAAKLAAIAPERSETNGRKPRETTCRHTCPDPSDPCASRYLRYAWRALERPKGHL